MSILYEVSTRLIRGIYDSRLSEPAVLDTSERFPAAQRFVDAWTALRDEALQLAENIDQVPRFHELLATQADISANDKGDWRMFVLKAYGSAVPHNMAQCPVLAGLVESEPDILTATLSYLSPHKHIPQHRGPFRGVLRFYMGLSIPTGADDKPSTVLTIDGTDYRIGDGECILWDDTYPHEVLNRSDSPRIALLLDVRRRGMPLDMELLSRLLIGVVGTAVRFRKI
jgi:aspartate beta-hydroxylase